MGVVANLPTITANNNDPMILQTMVDPSCTVGNDDFGFISDELRNIFNEFLVSLTVGSRVFSRIFFLTSFC